MKSTQQTFNQLMQSFGYAHNLNTVFDDLLTLTICAFSQNPSTGISYDEDLYLETIGKYSKTEANSLFPALLGQLIVEMEEKQKSGPGNDVLGDFYEQHLSKGRNGQFFTPRHVCDMMAAIQYDKHTEGNATLRVLDPSCGSGRMLMAGAGTMGRQHEFYGIDIDHMCVKMTAINLFLNGIFHSEVLWGNALDPADFRMSYRISFLPFGIFRVQEKELSKLWHMHRHSFEKAVVTPTAQPFRDAGAPSTGSQLQLF